MELTIEKLIYGGDGLARLVSGQQAKAVLVPYVLPGERVEAAIAEEKPGYARADLDRVIESSKLRSTPPCPYFGKCGGCHYQHAGYDDQLRFKIDILKETFRRMAKLELPVEIQAHASPPLNYRNRTRFHVRTRPEFAIGYFRHASHELLLVRECPISSALINRALTELWALGEAHQIPAELEEIELFANDRDERLLVELYAREEMNSDAVRRFAETLAQSMSEISGVVAFYRSGANASRKRDSELLWGESFMNYAVADEIYRVSAGAFFQVNRHLVGQMVELIANGRKGNLALDVYAGVGLFTLPLARRFERVIAVESSDVSAEDLRRVAPANVKVSAQSAEKFLANKSAGLRPDLIVVDPPRAGLGKAVCEAVAKLSPQEIVYVSCDPATLSRDLRELTSTGFQITQMHLIDLFPQTFHIESCAVLGR